MFYFNEAFPVERDLCNHYSAITITITTLIMIKRKQNVHK